MNFFADSSIGLGGKAGFHIRARWKSGPKSSPNRLRGRRSRNKVSVGEPAEGSFTRISNFTTVNSRKVCLQSQICSQGRREALWCILQHGWLCCWFIWLCAEPCQKKRLHNILCLHIRKPNQLERVELYDLSYNFQRGMSRLKYRGRAQQSVISNVNCKIPWVMSILNVHCTLGLSLKVCLLHCLYKN